MQVTSQNESAQAFDTSPVAIALHLASQGLPVFPCHATGEAAKRPYTKHGFHDATADAAAVRAWWQKWPAALVGLRTGSASGIAVLDLDVKAGKDGISAVRGRGLDPDFASPLIVPTLSGTGRHLYFQHSDGAQYQQDTKAGIDVKAEGGYVIAYRPFDLPELPPFPAAFFADPPNPYSLDDLLAPAVDWTEVRRALSHISADCDRDTWIRVGMALHHAGADLDLWANWSRTALPLNAASDREMAQQWKSFGRSKTAPVTLATLFQLAGYGRTHVDETDFADLPVLQSNPAAPAITFGRITRTKGGRPETTLNNAIAFLHSVNEQKGYGLRFNAMTGRDEWQGGLISDADLSLLRVAIEQAGMPNVGGLTPDAVRAVARLNQYHPIQDWLEGLTHDGTARIDTWLPRYLGAEDSPYTRAVGLAFLIAMIARVMQPGCKHDHVLVLGGKQGIGKSTACHILGGQWTGDDMPSIRDGAREAGLYLRGHWLVELAELAPSRKAEAEDLKSFLTRATDEIRAPYARRSDIVPRQCVFVGTTNETEFLRDSTGGRRFWPVDCGAAIDTDALAEDRNQLFAEALAAFRSGEAWHLSADVEALARSAQDAVREKDPWESVIWDYLNPTADDFHDGKPVAETSVIDVLRHLGIPSERMRGANGKRVGKIIRDVFGWQMKKTKRGNIWARVESGGVTVESTDEP